jgi:4-amino-4-deoxy-L-arabinose transferase-like glycosyltransferase
MRAVIRPFPRSLEWPILIAIVFVAIVFRFQQFNQVPPGLHYDEAIDAHIAQEIRSGNWAIYFEEGWGREPLYHTLVAFTENFISDPTSALRFTSALLGLIQLVAAYFLFKKMFDVPTALIGAAWIAMMFWAVSTSRAGLRNITLTTFATLTALAFWNVFSKWQVASSKLQEQITRHSSLVTNHLALITSGLLLGLTFYTYQPSRVVPLIFLIFIVYLLLRGQIDLKTHWRSIAVFFGLTLIIAVPLIVFLVQHPTAETGRAFQTEPIRALLRGDPGPALGTTLATLKMFTFDGGGDPQPLYNISGRPLFIGLGSILFYIGLIVCTIRWKQPAYAFILIWLIVTLLPNMVTAPAPFFYRAIAAQTPTMALPAIAIVAIGDFIHRRERKDREEENKNFSLRTLRLGSVTVFLLAVVSLGQTAITTQHDYFDVWGQDGDVRFQYSAAHTEIAHALDASNDSSAVIISGYFTEDADPFIFSQTLHRSDLSIGWFDARESLVALADASVERVALPSFTPLEADLKSRFLNNAQPITAAKDFKIYSLDADALRKSIDRWSGEVGSPERLSPFLPISFDNNIDLIGYERSMTVTAGSTLSVFTAWRITSEWQPSSTAIFIHFLKPNGSIAAQDDRLGYPRHNWHTGDEFVQVHHLSIGDLPPGKYSIELGIYSRDTNVRWAARDRSGRALGDHILIGSIEIVP